MAFLTRQLNVVIDPTMFETLVKMTQKTGLSQGAIVRKAIELMNAQISHQDEAA